MKPLIIVSFLAVLGLACNPPDDGFATHPYNSERSVEHNKTGKRNEKSDETTLRKTEDLNGESQGGGGSRAAKLGQNEGLHAKEVLQTPRKGHNFKKAIQELRQIITEQLKQNPLFQREDLPRIQGEIAKALGYYVNCHEDLLEHEIAKCYKAIDNLLLAHLNGLEVPTNPKDAFPIEEIIVIKGRGKMYEAAKRRFHIEVNFEISADDWPHVLESQIHQFGRKNLVYRHQQLKEKLALLESAFARPIVVDEDYEIDEMEKGLNLLSLLVDLEDSLSNSDSLFPTYKDKDFEFIRLTDTNRSLYENNGVLIVDLDINSSSLEALQFLDRQDKSHMAKNFKITRQHVDQLLTDTIQNLSGGREITCDLNQEGNWYTLGFTKKGISMEECHGGLLKLRAALSGGDLEEMDIFEIIIGNKVFNVKGKVKTADTFINLNHSFSIEDMYDALWSTTPEGKAYWEEQVRIRSAALSGGMSLMFAPGPKKN